jgi:hypothetical protein
MKDIVEAVARYRRMRDLEKARTDATVNNFAVMKLGDCEGHVKKNLQTNTSGRTTREKPRETCT